MKFQLGPNSHWENSLTVGVEVEVGAAAISFCHQAGPAWVLGWIDRALNNIQCLNIFIWRSSETNILLMNLTIIEWFAYKIQQVSVTHV